MSVTSVINVTAVTAAYVGGPRMVQDPVECRLPPSHVDDCFTASSFPVVAMVASQDIIVGW